MFLELRDLQSIRKQQLKKIKKDNTINKLCKNIPLKLIPFMQSDKMYQVIYGGRTSGKTHTALLKLLKRALEKPNQTILCTREFQSSIATSTHAELKQIIYNNNLDNLFSVKRDYIECVNGTRFVFKGLARDITQIKSMPNISICFVEEAETIARHLWDVLDPTLRKEGCELIILFNPRERQSATYQKWLEEPLDDNDVLRIEINYTENPFNSPTILKKIEWMKLHDYARYEHIYLGKVLDISEDVIFKGRFKILDMDVIKEGNKFTYKGEAVSMLYGMDFGFSQDPTAMIELCYLDEHTIYIHNEIYSTGILITNYIELIKSGLGEHARYSQWCADCSRPDSIAQLSHDGLKIEGAPKPKGSVESGIEYLLAKNIIIHPRCKNMIFEAYNYKYKKDKNSGMVTSEIIDAHNHAWDSIRYALYKQISASLQKPFKFNTDALKRYGIS